MTNSEYKPQSHNSRDKQDKDRADGEQEGNDKAPGKNSESGYPDDSYWEHGTRDKSKAPPTESPEPETGYRWESSEDKVSPNADEKESDS